MQKEGVPDTAIGGTVSGSAFLPRDYRRGPLRLSPNLDTSSQDESDSRLTVKELEDSIEFRYSTCSYITQHVKTTKLVAGTDSQLRTLVVL